MSKKILVLVLVVSVGAIITVLVDKAVGVKVGVIQAAVYMLWGAATYMAVERLDR
jgi:hypothetical protein